MDKRRRTTSAIHLLSLLKRQICLILQQKHYPLFWSGCTNSCACVSRRAEIFFFSLLLFIFFFFMTSMIYGSHNTLCPAKNVAVLFSTRQLSYKKTQFSIAHLRKKGKLHNAVATCILDKCAKIFPASHKWAHSQKMHLNGLRLKDLGTTWLWLPPLLWRLGIPPAHQQHLHVLTA